MAEVQLPQLGESVTEGIVTRWLVDVGDEVTVDQPIVEISTDKVDTEIPSPVAGTVAELRFDVDDTVEVGQTLAVIESGDASQSDTDEDADTSDEADTDDEKVPDDESGAKPDTEPDPNADSDTDGRQNDSAAAAKAPADGATPAPDSDASASSDARTASNNEGGPPLASPLVRRMLRDAKIDPASISGTGKGGRITREDAEQAIAAGPSIGAGAPAAPAAARPEPSSRERPPASPLQVDFGEEREVTQDLSRIRKAVGRAMMESLHHTAQLTAAVEADLTALMLLREAVKNDFKAREGASLTPLVLIARAVCMTLARHPALNASIDQEAGTATFRRYINLGIAVDTERGLLVPNIKEAHDLSVAGIARAIGDLATRTRGNKLGPDDIQGGTFTITNTGSMGTLFDTPILNPPEVAILATPRIEKRPVVISDAFGDSIAIRWMTYLCLTYDHRMVDGADAARYLQDLKYVLEEHHFASELGG